MEVNILYLY